jgi:hypothetical protein
MMSIRSVIRDGFHVDDASPDGGQREEDTDDGGCDDAEFDDVAAELEAGYNSWDVLALD